MTDDDDPLAKLRDMMANYTEHEDLSRFNGTFEGGVLQAFSIMMKSNVVVTETLNDLSLFNNSVGPALMNLDERLKRLETAVAGLQGDAA